MSDPQKDAATGVLQDPQAADEQTVELPDSRAEPGGPPVRVDPAMVDEETADAMRPLERTEPAGPERPVRDGGLAEPGSG